MATQMERGAAMSIDGIASAAGRPLAPVLAVPLRALREQLVEAAVSSVEARSSGGDADTVRLAARVLIDRWLRGGDLRDDERQRLRLAGARWADQGFALDDVQQTVRCAQDFAWDAAVRAAAELPPSRAVVEALGAGARDLAAAAHATGAALTAGCAQRAASTRVHGAAGVLSLLLQGSFGSDEQMIACAARAGVDLRAPCGFMLLVRAGKSTPLPPPRDVVQSLAVLLRAVDAGAGPRAGAATHATLVLPGVTASRWEEAVRLASGAAAAAGVAVLAGDPLVAPSAIHADYQAARGFLGVALRLPQRRPLVRLRDLRVHRLLSGVDAECRRRFVEEVAGSILGLGAAQRDRLLLTLEALRVHRHQVQAAAHALGVDPRTVRNRMAQIRRLTGLAADAEEMRLLPYLLELSETLSPGPRPEPGPAGWPGAPPARG